MECNGGYDDSMIIRTIYARLKYTARNNALMARPDIAKAKWLCLRSIKVGAEDIDRWRYEWKNLVMKERV